MDIVIIDVIVFLSFDVENVPLENIHIVSPVYLLVIVRILLITSILSDSINS